MSMPDPKSLDEFAREVVRSHAQDIERMSVGEMMSGDPRFDEVTEDELEDVEAAVYDRSKAYAKALSWPDEQPTAEQGGAPGGYQLRYLTDDEARELRARFEASEAVQDRRPLIERLPAEDAERVAALIDERDCWRREVLELRAKVAEQDGDVRAYPGRPGDGWQDEEGAMWVHCADGKMRMIAETEEPEDPAELDERFGPMHSLALRDGSA